ncbi:MAG: tetratricopeptide repeat protein [Methanothrix sp.]
MTRAWIICLLVFLVLPSIECIFAQDTPEIASPDPADLIRKGNDYRIMGDHINAVKVYNKAIELDLQNVDVGKRNNGFRPNDNRYKQAYSVYNEPNQSKNREAWYGKGLLFELQRNYEEANWAFDNATRIDYEYTDAWRHKGIVLSRMGDDQGAFCANFMAYYYSSEDDPVSEPTESTSYQISTCSVEGPHPTEENPNIDCETLPKEKASKACQK